MLTMTVKRFKSARGVGLFEVMVAMAILAIAALGALGYQYYAAAQARIAHAQTTATHTGQLLLEDWKSTGGSVNYDPSALNLGFSSPLSLPHQLDEGQVQGNLLHDGVYAITVDDLPMLIMLRWDDIAHDSAAEVTLRRLDVVIRSGEISEQDGYRDLLSQMRPVILTTYVRLDSAGG